jgi:hypothetical protein
MAESYAPTRALQQVVRGHETAVLAALGIAWQGGAQHKAYRSEAKAAHDQELLIAAHTLGPAEAVP